MSRTAVEELIDRWMNDTSFREEMRQDPQGTVHQSGAVLDDEEWETLRGIDWTLSDQELELQTRDNKNW